MATTNGVWCLLVDQYNKTFGRRVKVQYTDADNIADLKEKVKEKCLDTLSHIGHPCFTVWRLPESLNNEDSEVRENQVRDTFLIKKAILLDEAEKVAHLGLSEGETLLVHVTSASALSSSDRSANPPP